MEFLYKLYSNNYFGIGLFIVITVLAFAFLVILFFGKRDEKVRNEKEIEKQRQSEEIIARNSEEKKEPDLEIENIKQIAVPEEPKENISIETEIPDSFSFDEEVVREEPITSISNEEVEYFTETPKEELDPFATSNIVLNTDYITQEEPVDSFSAETEIPSRSSDIYNLDSIINEEPNPVQHQEESIDDVLNKYDAIEERIIENNPMRDIAQEEKINLAEEPEVNAFSRPNDTVRKGSTPFSSVYLTKEEADTNVEEVEEPKENIPNRSAFEMPKRVDLPKRSSGAINESIISSIYSNNQENHTDNIFDNFEDDTYNLKK